MNHQPFENWLLADEPLAEADERALREHLTGCNQCNDLENAWLDVANLFVEIPDVEPSPGFTNRWQANLEADRAVTKAMRQRWQSWIVLVMMANAAALVFLLMSVQLARTYNSFSDLLLSWVYRAATVMVVANGFQNALVTLFRTIPGLIPIGWWVGIGIILSASTLLWIVSMAKLTSLPRRTL